MYKEHYDLGGHQIMDCLPNNYSYGQSFKKQYLLLLTEL